MQKKLIALAVAGLASSAAFAQSNVTIYGVVDQVVQHSKAEATSLGVTASGKRNGLDAGYLAGSRLGFKGEEDLGNGLKAVFLLEEALTVDANQTAAGTAGIFGRTRQAYVGLAGNWGRLSFGQQYAPGYFAPGDHDGFASGTVSPQSILSVASGMTITPNNGARINNAINYVSPSWSGVSVNAIYGFGEPTTGLPAPLFNQDSKSGNVMGAGVTYANGPISANVTWHQTYNFPAVNTAAVKNTEWYVGGAYDFGVVKLGASYQNQKGGNNAAGTGDGKDKLWQVSAIAPVGKGNVHFAYGKLKDNNVVANVADALDNAKSWTLAYTHGLSKRTTAYAGFNQTKVDDGLDTAAGGIDSKTTTYGVGLRHVF